MKNLDYITCEYIEEVFAEEINVPIEKNNSSYESMGTLAEALDNMDFTNEQIKKCVNRFFVSVVKDDYEKTPLALKSLRGNCISLIADAIALKIRVDEAIATVESGCDRK